MSNKVAWVIVAVAVLVGAYFLFMRDDNTSTVENSGNEETGENENIASAGSFRDLLNSGQSQRCTFSDAESNSDGTVYVSGGRMRGDFTADVNGSEGMGHMIVKDNTFYMWMDGQSQGFQFSLEGEAQADMMNAEFADLDREVDYDCDSATVLDSQFDLPTGVTFTSFGDINL